MAAYWEADGVDDQLAIAGSYAGTQCNFTSFELDCMVLGREDWHQIFNFGGKTINFSSNTLNVVFHADYEAVYVNGVQVTSGTAFVPIGTRIMLRGVLKSGITTGGTGSLAFTNSISQFLNARLYDLKCYQGATLALQYDPSTGTMLDQTGNGRNATVTGGTYGSDAAPTAHVGGGTASSRSVATASGVRALIRGGGTSSSKSAAVAAARRDIAIGGAAVSVSSALASGRRALLGSGVASSRSTGSGAGYIGSFEPVHHSGGGTASSRSVASATASRGLFGGGQANSRTSVAAFGRRALRGSGGAISRSVALFYAGVPVERLIHWRASREIDIPLKASRRINIEWKGSI